MEDRGKKKTGQAKTMESRSFRYENYALLQNCECSSKGPLKTINHDSASKIMRERFAEERESGGEDELPVSVGFVRKLARVKTVKWANARSRAAYYENIWTSTKGKTHPQRRRRGKKAKLNGRLKKSLQKELNQDRKWGSPMVSGHSKKQHDSNKGTRM